MLLVKTLKRKDAFSVVVAIIIAMIVAQPLTIMTAKPASILSGESNQAYGPGGSWQLQYLNPIVWALLQLVVLEVLCWLCLGLAKLSMKGKK